MSSDATIAKAAHVVPADNSEAKAIKVFIAIVLAVIAVAVVLGLTVGLAGIGALAIVAAGAMLVICIVLTAG